VDALNLRAHAVCHRARRAAKENAACDDGERIFIMVRELGGQAYRRNVTGFARGKFTDPRRRALAFSKSSVQNSRCRRTSHGNQPTQTAGHNPRETSGRAAWRVNSSRFGKTKRPAPHQR